MGRQVIAVDVPVLLHAREDGRQRQPLELFGVHDVEPLTRHLDVHDRHLVRDAQVPAGEYGTLRPMRQVRDASFLLGLRQEVAVVRADQRRSELDEIFLLNPLLALAFAPLLLDVLQRNDR